MSPPEPTLDIPERYEDVSAEWLTQALRTGGVLGDQAVSTFRIEPLGADRSRTSSLARITVEYDGHPAGLPDSMFAKFVSRIPDNREFVAEFGLFRREIELYENLGDAIPMNMPRLYFGLAPEGSDVAVILLEEIKAISKAALSAEERLTAGEIKLALRDLSKMHAKWWEDQVLDAYTWLGTMDSGARRSLYQLYDEAWARMRDALEPALTPAEVRICSGLSSYLPTLMSELNRMPVTLCHGDFHGGNLLWDETGEPRTVWAVDWQIATKGPAIIDVAWFLGTGVTRVDVHLVRRDYLPEYHSALLARGVAHYEHERFLSDYRYGVLNGLTRLIALLANLDFAVQDFVESARWLVGDMAAAEDAGCAKLIS